MSTRSVRTFFQHELKRLKDRFSDTSTSLESVETIETVGDCIDPSRLGRRLPAGWYVDRDIVQFPGESLTEVIRLTDAEGYQITLKPVDIHAPHDSIEIYTRTSPHNSRQRRQTVSSLSEAVMIAMGIAARRHTKPDRPNGQSTESEISSQ